MFPGETFDLPTAILPLFLSPLGLSHFGFVLELGDLTFVLTEPEPKLCELACSLLILKASDVELAQEDMRA